MKAKKIERVSDIVLTRLPRYGKRVVVRYDDGAAYQKVGGEAYLSGIWSMCEFFRRQDTGRQLVVSTLTKNRPEWDMTAFASMYTGQILSPLDTKMNDEELRHLLTLNAPDVALVALNQRDRFHRLCDELGLDPVILIPDIFPAYQDRGFPRPDVLGDEEVAMADLAPMDGPGEASDRLNAPGLVLARYSTSGTTNLPKVVSITQENIVFQLSEAMSMINLRKNEDVLSIGPYTHIATLLEFLVAKTKGFTVSYFTRDAEEDGVLETEIKKLKRQGVRIRCLMAVPKFWTFLMKEVLEEMNGKPVFQNLYRHLVSIEKSDHFYDIGTLDKAKLVAARTLLRNKLGGHFAYGISSSTKVEPGVIDIFAKLGITVIDVYGATECSGVIARNELNLSRRGSCGRLLDGYEYRLEGERHVPGIDYPVGELYLRGDGVASAYMGTEDVLDRDDDGFYATGDIAYVDPERWVYLVGREKEQIRWEDGGYTDPWRVSNMLVRSIWIKDALVIRHDGEDMLSAFVYPDYARLHKADVYREGKAKGLTDEQILRPLLEDAIRYAQSLLGDSPAIKTERIYILARKLERTPTHKVKLISELKTLDYSRFL